MLLELAFACCRVVGYAVCGPDTRMQFRQQLTHCQTECLAAEACKSPRFTPAQPSASQTAFMGQSLLAQAGNADAPVVAFAAAVAQLLLLHIAEQAPAEVSSALSHQLKQQVSQAAADVAAAGRQFTITDALQQLLPQLSALATNASLLAHMEAAAAAASAVFMPAESSTGCAGQLTLIDLTRLNNHNPAPHQYQQQQLCCSHLRAAHASTALVPSGCVNLPTAMAAMHPLLQQQQGAWSTEQVPCAAGKPGGAVDVPQCSECGSTCD